MLNTQTSVDPSYLTVQQYAAARQLPESWVYSRCRLYVRTKGKRGLRCKKFGTYTRIPAGVE